MLNNNTNIKMGSNTNNVTFNTPSTGMMQRSHPKSFFVRFQKGSTMEKKLFPTYGEASHIVDSNNVRKILVDVLQILIFGDDFYLVEIVRTEHLSETTEESK